ncbi:FecR domain-containing protein [Rapidithrix thailandica]|uniref:FecR domain-containing protein n=1 Tax=Rapidithrix thailandica TaxID=413964 RepID=A0AAW9SF52_9BACT
MGQPDWNILAKYLAKETSEEETKKVEQWIVTHPGEFEQLKKIWNVGHSTDETPVDVLAGKAYLQSRLDKNPQRGFQVHRNTSKRWAWTKVAAVVALLLGLAISLTWWNRIQETAAFVTLVEKYSPEGSRQIIQLADGTLVHLNAGSRLRFPKVFTGKSREVFLQGEAFFEVARDTTQPFIIRTGNLVTRVLGTSFNVAAYPEDSEVKVSVATGKVEVYTEGTEAVQGEKVQLLPHRQAVFAKANQQFQVQPFELASVCAWKEGTLRFMNTALPEVCKQLERWYGVTFELQSESLKACSLSGEFHNRSLQHVLEAISYTNGLRFEMHQDSVVLSGEGCL